MRKIVFRVIQIIILFIILKLMFDIMYNPVTNSNIIADNFTDLGINTMYVYSYGNDGNVEYKISVAKVLFTTAMLATMYVGTICIANNLVQGMKYIIRNKSRSLLDYKIKVYKFFYKGIFIDMIIFIGMLCVVLLFEHSEINNIQILIMNMIKIFLMYSIIALELIFIVDNIEIYVVFLQLIATLFRNDDVW
nr:hypothetical protein [Clostridiales bacterium]